MHRVHQLVNALSSVPKSVYKPMVRQPVTIKYMLRPNIKGSTRGKRSYCTFLHSGPMEMRKSLLVKYPITGRNYFHTTPTARSIDPTSKSTEMEHAMSDAGLGIFLKKVYLSTGLGFSGALATSLACAPLMETTPEFMLGAIVTGIVGAFSSIYVFQKTEPRFVTKTIHMFDKNVTTMQPVYTTSKYMSSITLCASMGLMMSPLVSMAGPVLVAQAAGISLAVMAGSSLYAMYAKPGSLLPYRSVAFGALAGLVGIGLSSIAVGLIFGTGHAFQLLHSIDLYGGLALFTVLNAIDTHNAIDTYRKNQPDYLSCSIEMMLNAINIFVRVLEILAKAQKK